MHHFYDNHYMQLQRALFQERVQRSNGDVLEFAEGNGSQEQGNKREIGATRKQQTNKRKIHFLGRCIFSCWESAASKTKAMALSTHLHKLTMADIDVTKCRR
jgi:hypothetical protein